MMHLMRAHHPSTFLRHSVSLSAFGAVFCCMLLTASATTLLKLDLEALTTKSETIVHGQVDSIDFRKEEGRVYTYVTLSVHDVLKGDEAQEEVEFRMLGGRHGEYITIVHGTPTFAQDEEVLVFLERPLEDKPLVVTGMVQGKFRVSRGPDGETRYVVPNINGMPLVERLEVEDRDGQIRARLQETSPDPLHEEVVTLEDFKMRLESLKSSEQ